MGFKIRRALPATNMGLYIAGESVLSLILAMLIGKNQPPKIVEFSLEQDPKIRKKDVHED